MAPATATIIHLFFIVASFESRACSGFSRPWARDIFETSRVQYSHNRSRWPFGQIVRQRTAFPAGSRKPVVRRSGRQGRLALLQEAADGGVAFEADGDFVGAAGLCVRSG